MSVISQAQEILEDVQDIRTAIVGKGGTVSTLSTFAQAITDLPSGGGMPAIPSSFTTLNLNQSYTASGDGWVKYKISYYWGTGQSAYLNVGSRTYQITASGEDMDVGWIEMEGIAPVYSGEAFQITANGLLVPSHSYLKVAYL